MRDIDIFALFVLFSSMLNVDILPYLHFTR